MPMRFCYLASRPEVIGDRRCLRLLHGRAECRWWWPGRLPDRVAAAALSAAVWWLTADSPHLLADRIQRRLHRRRGERPSFTADHAAEKLDKAFSAAGVPHRVEVLPGRPRVRGRTIRLADAAADERHWAANKPDAALSKPRQADAGSHYASRGTLRLLRARRRCVLMPPVAVRRRLASGCVRGGAWTPRRQAPLHHDQCSVQVRPGPSALPRQ